MVAARRVRLRRLAPPLFEEQDREAAPQLETPVEKTQVSEGTEAKGGKQTPQGLPMRSLRTQLADLPTLAQLKAPEYVFLMHAQPTPVQHEAVALLGVDAARPLTSSRTD